MSPRILIVDDEPAIRRLAERSLTSLGFEAVLAEGFMSGRSALDEGQEFDVIISDLSLGDGEGLELLRYASQGHGHARCIIMTGDPSMESARHALRMGAVDYLIKPFGARELREAVANAVAVKELDDYERDMFMRRERRMMDMEESSRSLRERQSELMDASRESERFELISSLRHAMGNSLNRVYVGAGGLQEIRLEHLCRDMEKLAEYVETNPAVGSPHELEARARRCSAYLRSLHRAIVGVSRSFDEELTQMRRQIRRAMAWLDAEPANPDAPVVLERCSLQDLVQEALQKSGILDREWIVRWRTDERIDVLVERGPLRRLLVALMDNAAEAMAEIPTQNVARVLELEMGRDEKGRGWLELHDSGPGVPLELRDRIFQMGFSTKQEHLGWGLHAAALTAERMGAELTLLDESHLGGAAFRLLLTLNPSDVASRRAVQAE